MLDLIQTGDQLIEGLTIDDQATNTLGTFTDNVCRAQIISVKRLRRIDQLSSHSAVFFFDLPLQRLLAKEVSLAEHPDELLLLRILLLDRYTHLALGYDKEGVTPCTLSHYIIAALIVCLLQNIGDFDERILGQVLEDGHTGSAKDRVVHSSSLRKELR